MPSHAARKHWMGVLAKAPSDALAEAFDAAGAAPDFVWLRPPEFGAVMVRGRAGGTGAPFNLGEITVTRCSLRLTDGAVGHGYIAGRDREKARIAALCDAMLQGDRAAVMRRTVLEPMERLARTATQERAEKAAATRVEFFTVMRGENL